MSHHKVLEMEDWFMWLLLVYHHWSLSQLQVLSDPELSEHQGAECGMISHTSAVPSAVSFPCSKGGAGSFWFCCVAPSSHWLLQRDRAESSRKATDGEKVTCLNTVLQWIQFSLLHQADVLCVTGFAACYQGYVQKSAITITPIEITGGEAFACLKTGPFLLQEFWLCLSVLENSSSQKVLRDWGWETIPSLDVGTGMRPDWDRLAFLEDTIELK